MIDDEAPCALAFLAVDAAATFLPALFQNALVFSLHHRAACAAADTSADISSRDKFTRGLTLGS